MSSNNNLGMVEAKLPPGFRFHPRDIELICDYLMKKICRCEQEPLLLIEVDLNKSEPWDIPGTTLIHPLPQHELIFLHLINDSMIPCLL
ncbi:hypothetical protein LguiB_030316 [Lonicera macranthoides]